MKNKKLKIFASLSIFSVLLLMGGSSALADFEAINDHTGFNSTNEVSAMAAGEFIIFNENLEAILNFGNAISETGNNLVEDNTGDGELISGEIEVEGEFVNEANVNVAEHENSWLGDFMARNSHTGADSDNLALAEFEEFIEIDNLNEISLENEIEVEANTGDNRVQDNTGDGELETGDAEARIRTENEVNGNFLEIDQDSSSFSVEVGNETTGADSDNEAEVLIEDEVIVLNENIADVFNDVFVDMMTGDNRVQDNTGDAELETGDVDVEVEIENEINRGRTEIEVAFGGGDIEIENEETGFGSDNEARAEINNLLDVVNENFADILNLVDTQANTGDNRVDDNTGDVDAETGDVDVEVEISNGSSSNGNSSVLEIGMGDVDIELFNERTGADSDNLVEVILDNEVVLINTNELSVENDVQIQANTGDNRVQDNTGDSELETGDANAEVRIENEMNLNQTEIDLDPDIDIELGNSNTGADSSNEARAEVSNIVEVVNTNNVQVINDVSTEMNTGNNNVSGNTGDGGISTGGSNISFGVSNQSNGNSVSIGD